MSSRPMPPDAPSRCPVTAAGRTFDPFGADYLQDPYPHLREIRAQEPVFFSPDLDYWVVSRYEDVRHCFSNQDDFSARIALEPIVPPFASSLAIMTKHALAPVESLVNEDPPLHHLRRKRLARAFSAPRMKALEPFVRALATSYIDRFVQSGQTDLVASMFHELPALVIFKFFGIPDNEVETVKAYAGPLALFIWGRPNEEEQNHLVGMLGAYAEYSRMHISRLTASARGLSELSSDYVQAHIEDPDLFPKSYIADLLPNFLYAGHETTTSQAGNAVRILLENAQQWTRICADAGLIPNATEECLRSVSSVIAWRRLTKRAVTVCGVEIPAGSKLLIYNGAANRDPDVFEHPDIFAIDRDNARRHLAFGYGAHLCIGAPLARMEIKVILEELSRRLPHMKLVPGQTWSYSANTSFRGPQRLLVEWDPALNPVPRDRPAL